MSTMFSTLLSWIVGFALFVPMTLLRLVGLLFPTCAEFGITTFANSVSTSAANWILFLYPVLKFVPWTFVWNFLSAVFLYIFVSFLIRNLPRLLPFVLQFWWVIVLLYVVAGAINVFTTFNWMSSSAFTEVFGNAPTTTGSVGGGFGGGGGGGW